MSSTTIADKSSLIKDKTNLSQIKLFAYDICSEYLNGAWKSSDLNQFKLTRIR